MSGTLIGHIDAVGPVISGWATAPGGQGPLTVCCVLDDTLWLSTRADLSRPDVAEALGCCELCGFSFTLPPMVMDGGEHALALGVLGNEVFRFPGAPGSVVLGQPEISVFRADLQGFLAACPDAAGLQNEADAPLAVFLAQACGRAVGYALCLGPEHGTDPGCRRFLLDVRPPWRGHGAGSRLVERMLAWARGQGMLGLRTSVALPDGGVVAFFERRGFRVEAVRKAALEGQDGPRDVADLGWAP
ncbi:GNAT family N-acetyltransferase [Fundidesulfovibrio agrisoli]|uniref:GNAT family N-acetyltransferase n=1 Tax=Fundidesulfovibrio agrisoli TaxID=2922717 RepID=UPI001FADF0FF|nr:GNAT family N-acetyltransferase [Fundidesulfovibrio agrisoli]